MTSGTGDACTNDRSAVRGKWRTRLLVLTFLLQETGNEHAHEAWHRGQRQGHDPDSAGPIDPDTVVPSAR